MNRSKFLGLSFSAITGSLVFNKGFAGNMLQNLKDKDYNMPALFMGHGNPMNAISDNESTRAWFEITKSIPKPKAILCISAHWETSGTKVSTVQHPKMIYDMYGFPEELYRVQYPCPGSEEYAQSIIQTVKNQEIMPDLDWGLDHGAWSLLVKMYPKADIPCFQLSLNKTRDLQWHYELGKQLSFLRKKGVLIIGSGNIVHNLRYARMGQVEPYNWAVEFDQFSKQAIDDGNHRALINYQKAGNAALLSVNSAEHFIPLLYILALQEKSDEILQFNESIDFGSGSMRCLKLG